MAGKTRGMGHAFREYQLAVAGAAQARGSAGTDPLLGGVRVAAPLSIDMLVSEYDRRFDRRYARAIRDLLHELAKERAARTNVLPKKAFREVCDALRNRFKLGEHGTLYLLATARTKGVRPASLEEALAFVNGFLTRTEFDRLPEKERFRAAWRTWDSFLHLFHVHVPCVGMGNMGTETLLRSLDLWQATGLNVAPCHAMRVTHVAERHGFDAEVIAALAREHGAERLDDVARLMEDGIVTPESVWEFQSRPELVRALTRGQIVWLMREWHADPSTDLLAFARDRRRDLRRQRGPLFAGKRPTAILIGSTANAIDSVYRETTAEERAKAEFLQILRVHDKACGPESWAPDAYVPSDDAILGSAFECPAPLASGLARRLALAGDALEERAERACRLFGDAPPDRTLFALDLLAEWEGMADPALCLRAAVACGKARVPDSLAFDLLARFGRDHAEEAVGLVEDGLVGLRECQRLLKYPALIVERRGRMRDLLERYRAAGSPADICAFACRRPVAGSRGSKPERTVPAAAVSLRNDTALDDPARYLAAIDAAEARSSDLVAEPEPPAVGLVAAAPVPDPVSAPTEPATEAGTDGNGPETSATERREEPGRTMSVAGPLAAAMESICPDCAKKVAEAWASLRRLDVRLDMSISEALDRVEDAFARMVRFEHAHHRLKDHRRYFVEALKTILLPGAIARVGADPVAEDERVADRSAIELLVACERSGIRFSDPREFNGFRAGLRSRLVTPEFANKRSCWLPTGISGLLETHVPHVPASVRPQLAKDAVLVRAFDLFAELDGVAFCKCLRISAGFDRRKIGASDMRHLALAFAADRHVDDLVGILEDARVRTRDIERLLERPGLIRTSTYAALAS